MLKETNDYIDRVHELILARYGEPPRAFVRTFGCQQNVSDSEYIKGMLVSMGYILTEDAADASFVLYNTCAVREHAEDRVYGNIGELKKYKERHRGMITAVCGCMVMQQHAAERIKKSYPYVDIIFGTNMLHRLPEFLYRRLSGSARILDISGGEEIIEGMPKLRDHSLKAWLPIMYGCDNFCTYCVVPYVRGRERSRSSADIAAEARELIAAGAKDITLLGQNVNSYGLHGGDGVSFPELLRMINGIDGDFRIRFMTSYPKDCTDELLRAMAECGKVARHLHLPFQSGSNRVLRAMNRRYTSEDYLRLVARARELMPDISLTSDVIVGFPGETYDDFEKTLELIKKVRFTMLFTFIYSRREGTPAAAMADVVSDAEKSRWFDMLLREQEKISDEIMSGLNGSVQRVLTEGVKPGTDGKLYGRAANNMSVQFSGAEGLIGSFADVKITGFNHTVLYGEAAES